MDERTRSFFAHENSRLIRPILGDTVSELLARFVAYLYGVPFFEFSLNFSASHGQQAVRFPGTKDFLGSCVNVPHADRKSFGVREATLHRRYLLRRYEFRTQRFTLNTIQK